MEHFRREFDDSRILFSEFQCLLESSILKRCGPKMTALQVSPYPDPDPRTGFQISLDPNTVFKFLWIRVQFQPLDHGEKKRVQKGL